MGMLKNFQTALKTSTSRVLKKICKAIFHSQTKAVKNTRRYTYIFLVTANISNEPNLNITITAALHICYDGIFAKTLFLGDSKMLGQKPAVYSNRSHRTHLGK